MAANAVAFIMWRVFGVESAKQTTMSAPDRTSLSA